MDFLAASLAWIIFYTVRPNLGAETSIEFWRQLIGPSILVSGFWLQLYTLQGFYQDIFRKSRVKELLNLAQITFLGTLVLFFALLLEDQWGENFQSYYYSLGTYFILHFLISGTFKFIMLTRCQQLIRQEKVRFKTLLVGSREKVQTVAEDLVQNNQRLGLQIIGFVDVQEGPAEAEGTKIRRLGNCRQLPDLINEMAVEEVVIALEPSEHRQITQILGLLEGSPARISILPDMYQILLGSVRVTQIFGTPLIEIKHDLLPLWQQAAKRALDISVSALLLALFLPVYLIMALLVKFSSPGPVLYRQERVGKGGVPFRIYKFRSMYEDAEKNGPALSYDKDPRVTRWGRFMRKVHLDELPQFYNVLIGQMSLVGPRPERQFFIDQIIQTAPHYRHLLRVRPGITSLGLVKFGYAENVDEMIRRMSYDILYIENMSLAMDFRVLLYTIKVIVEGRGK